MKKHIKEVILVLSVIICFVIALEYSRAAVVFMRQNRSEAEIESTAGTATGIDSGTISEIETVAKSVITTATEIIPVTLSENTDSCDTIYSNEEIFEFFLNGELTVEQEEEQVHIDELFWYNDIEYCFLDIDGDGSEELHIRDSEVYYVINAVKGKPQIIFSGSAYENYMRYEPIDVDEPYGILYYQGGYGVEIVEFIKISPDGSRENDGEFQWRDQNKNGAIDEEDSFHIDYSQDIDMEQYVQYKEEQLAKQAGNEPEWTDRRLKNYATWQEAYIDFIVKPRSTIWTSEDNTDKYSLIYVDNDNVPELYVYTGSSVGGEFVVSYYDGKVRAMNRYRGGIKYIEYGGLLYSDWGHMGFYPMNIYMLEKGEFSEIGNGWYSERYDEEHEGIYWEYFWEEEEVTEAEYGECINNLIDTSKCIEPSVVYTKDEILEILADFDIN